MKSMLTLFLTTFLILPCSLQAVDTFFKVSSIRFHKEKSPDGVQFGFWRKDEKNPEVKPEYILTPFIEAKIKAEKKVKSQSVYVRAHFFDKDKRLVMSVNSPEYVKRGEYGTYAVPAFFDSGKTENIYFKLPEELWNYRGWSVIVIFGDYKGANYLIYPSSGELKDYNFPEQYYVNKKPSTRHEEEDPIMELKLRTKVPSYPYLTLFFQPSLSGKPSKGVFAACLIGNNVEEIKKQMMNPHYGTEMYDIVNFCKEYDLALLCWGSRRVWDRERNWNQYEKAEYMAYDETFDRISSTWKRGVDKLCEDYKIPNRNFLMWGMSGAAQYAMRLALRCPEYFHAIYVHIPSSFDKPTPAGCNVLWCITTGERESGYGLSLEFLNECRKLEYPFVYKAIPGLGHRGHSGANKLGFDFLHYAMTLLPERAKIQNNLTVLGETEKNKWKESFYKPAYWGDVANHKVYAGDRAKFRIPRYFRIPLPTKELADRWNISN